MKYLVLPLVFGLGYLASNLAPFTAAADEPKPVDPLKKLEDVLANPSIDMEGYLKVAQAAEAHRKTRRVTEDEFIKMSGEKGTIVLDARSKEMYDLLHVKGAINLSFPDIDTESLPRLLPDKEARILIYCNNNFTPGAGVTGVSVPVTATGENAKASEVVKLARQAFVSKRPTASLNISTYIALYNYGYKNVYELAPLLDPAKTKITFESNAKPTK